MVTTSTFVRHQIAHRALSKVLGYSSIPAIGVLGGSISRYRLGRYSGLPLYQLSSQNHWISSYHNRGLFWSFRPRSRDSEGSKENRLCQNYYDARDQSAYRYVSCQGRQLSKIWGSSGYGCGKPDHSSSSTTGPEAWYRSIRTKEEEMIRHFEAFKKRVDADPYGMLFGRRLQRKEEDRDLSNESEKKTTTSASERHNISPYRSSIDPKDQSVATEPKTSSSTRSATVSVTQNNQVEELEFDPITMRKVPKKRPPLDPIPKESERSDVPVKRLVPAISDSMEEADRSQSIEKNVGSKSASSEVVSDSKPTELTRGRFTREGSDTGSDCIRSFKPRPNPSQRAEAMGKKPFMIETAIDRLSKSQEIPAGQDQKLRPSLTYAAHECTTEDIDLLRPSDVRASSGIQRNPLPETAEAKQHRRKQLTSDFEKRNHELDSRLEEEIAVQKAQTESRANFGKSSPGPSALEPSLRGPNLTKISDSTSKSVGSETPIPKATHQNVLTSHQHETEKGNSDAAKSALEEEIEAQKAAMDVLNTRNRATSTSNRISLPQSQELGEGDMATSVLEFTDKSRWYTQKPPHAMEQDKLEAQQLAQDRNLVREIRAIYEDEYGVIDTKHRHLPKPDDAAVPEEPVTANLKSNESGLAEQKYASEGTANLKNPTIEQPAAQSLPALSDSHITSKSSTDHLSQPNSGSKTSKGLSTVQMITNELREIQRFINEFGSHIPGRSSVKIDPALLSPQLKAYEQNVTQALERILKLLDSLVLPNFCKSPNGEQDTPVASTGPPSDVDSKLSWKALPEEVPYPSPSASYRILAYDATTQRVLTAKLSSLASPTDEKPLTVAEALAGLANPAKFLPHLVQLQNAGFDIISGKRDILIFKKLRPGRSPLTSANEVDSKEAKNYSMHTNPIDGTTTQTGNFASPTGFVNYDPIFPSADWKDEPTTSKPSRASQTSHRMQREEALFSGSRRRWQEHCDEGESNYSEFRNKRRRAARRQKTLRRMLWVGVWVAGCCYAVGVASEALRA